LPPVVFFADAAGNTGIMESAVTSAMIAFLAVIAAGIVVMVISRLLDHIWASVLRLPWLYIVFAAPGVIVHECAHVLGCLVSGATITKVVLISKEGGMVSYTKPKIPIVGNVIISTAPLFCLPLVLAGLTWAFAAYARCGFFFTLPVGESVSSLPVLFAGIGRTLYYNLFGAFNGWFLLYLYLVTSLVLSAAPSRQDLKNAAAGLAFLAVTGVLLIFANIPAVTGAFMYLVSLISAGLTIGLAFELVALVVTLPFLLFYRRTS